MATVTETRESTEVPEPGRRRRAVVSWLTTTDHKKIGIMYIVTAFVFFLFGGLLAEMIRTQLLEPDSTLFDFHRYNSLFTMHAITMIFLFVMPVTVGFANYIVPLQIGAPDMAFPRVNAFSFWLFPLGGADLVAGSWLRTARRAAAGRCTRR